MLTINLTYVSVVLGILTAMGLGGFLVAVGQVGLNFLKNPTGIILLLLILISGTLTFTF